MMASEPRIAAFWTVPPAGLATWPGLALALAVAAVLCWPMLLSNGPLLYFDTHAYLSAGEEMLGFVQIELSALSVSEAALSGASAPTEHAPARGHSLRSIAYSLYAYLSAQTPLGLVLTTLLQTALTLWAVFALIPPGYMFRAGHLLVGLALVGCLSTLPWFASYAMPDMLTATLVVLYAVALRRLDALELGARLALLALAVFAVATHYGHFPLAAALAAAVLGWRAVQARLTPFVVAFCLLPILLPAAANFTSSQVALEEGSIAPKRLPILLARSLKDGPAAWYLNEACPEAGYAMCELFDEMPRNLGVFLWSDAGLGAASPEQFDRIRQEEVPILLAAFRAYPVAQLRSLLGNAALQTVSIGTDQILPDSARDAEGLLRTHLAETDPVLALFDWITPVATSMAALWLLSEALRGRLDRVWAEPLALILVAALVNAAIFGGLSAPVDRYQSRIVWLIPLLLALHLAGRSAQSHAGLARDRGPRRSG